MKYLYLLLTLFSFSAFAQPENCTQGAPQTTYQSFYTLISQQPNDQAKLDVALGLTAYNCVSSIQVKSIAMLFQQEQFKLDFGMLSYHNTFDKENYYDVYDAFNSFSMAFKLHDFVLEQRALEADQASKPQLTAPVVQAQLVFATYNYPSTTNYNGETGCSTAISDADFEKLAKQMSSYKSDEEKMVSGTVAAKNHCLTMTHAMKLASLFKLEAKRLEFLKGVFQYLYDQMNYASAKQCFKHQPYQQEWMTFCQDYFKPTQAEIEAKCEVDEAKMKVLLKQLDDAAFGDKQISLLKQMNKSYCFSVAQVKRIMGEFSFPENKLDAAIVLYDRCTNNESYYELKGSFTFPSYESDFEDFLNSH